jgi:eukaryotic-like serine/threonine-protein kinase
LGEPIPETSPSARPPVDRLESWKEIAAYLNRDVTTAQRWEKREGMPVHRHLHDKMGSVHASRAELDAWARSRAAQDNGDNTPTPSDPTTDAAVQSPHAEISPSQSRQSRVLQRAAAGASLVVLAAAASYAVYFFFGRPPAVPFQNFSISQITDNSKSRAAAISPDGKYILSEVDDAGKASLWLRHLATNSDTQIIAPADEFYSNLEFSPDGNHFYFLKARTAALDTRDLYRAPALGGNPQLIARDVDSNAALSRDGEHIAFSRWNDPEFGKFQILVANSDGTAEKTIATSPLSAAHLYLAWSPDGRRIALSGFADPQFMDAASGKTEDFAIARGFRFFRSIWLPDGRGLLVQYQGAGAGRSQTQIGFVSYPGGEFHAITKDTNSYDTMTLSSDAKTLATVQSKQSYTLYAIPATTMGAELPNPVVPRQREEIVGFSWAGNDGVYLAEQGQIVRVSAKGSGRTTVFSNASMIAVSACPDGRTVLVDIGGTKNETDIWRMDADGTNAKQLSDTEWAFTPECSPDSRWAYFSDFSSSRVFRVPVDGGTTETLPGTPIPHALIAGGNMDVSPDGKSVAFLAIFDEPNWSHKIAVVPVDAGPQPQIRWLDPHPGIGNGPRFTPDGRALIYPIIEHGVGNLWLQPLDGAPGRQITNFKTDTIADFRFSPDGKSVGVLSVRSEADVVLLRDTGSAPQ